MTVLSAQAIKASKIIVPFSERTIQENSSLTYGLGPCSYDLRLDLNLELKPKTYALASTLEYFNMPLDIMGRVHDKSTWIRRGVTLGNSIIDPGWRGYLTLEIVNHSENFFVLEAGTPIAQVVFEYLDAPTYLPYRGKYLDQERGPQEAR